MSHADHCPHCREGFGGSPVPSTGGRCPVMFGTQPDQLQCVLPAGHPYHPTEDSHVGVTADGRVVPFGGVGVDEARVRCPLCESGHKPRLGWHEFPDEEGISYRICVSDPRLRRRTERVGEARDCTRSPGHGGPCNGFPRVNCGRVQI